MRWLSATGTKRVPSFGDDVHLARDVAGEGVELRLRGVDVPEGEPEGLETWRMGEWETGSGGVAVRAIAAGRLMLRLCRHRILWTRDRATQTP